MKGKIALVTGGSSGIGKAIAAALVAEGAEVVICGRDRSKLAAAARELGGGDRVGTVAADVQSVEGCRRAVAATVEQYGGLDVLINSHGLMRTNKLEDVTEAEYDAMLATNVKGGFFLIQAAAPEMRKRGKGSIINIASIAGPFLGGVPTLSVYAITKAAIQGITHQLALELGPDNIRVNSIAPGNILTPLNEHMMADRAYVDWLQGRTPLRRIGNAAEVGAAAVYLASDDSSYTTGSTLIVDGGYVVG